MKVIKNGMLTEMKYNELCSELGFIAQSNFIKVSCRWHTIGWSCGKPEEILALKIACQEHGYKMSRNLKTFHK